MSGTGATVVAQEPAAGTRVARGSVVTLTFRYTDDSDDVGIDVPVPEEQ